MQLTLVRNPDIISAVARHSPRPLVVGFAAETDNIVDNGRHKLYNKKLDLLFANHATETFGSDTISVTAISKDEERAIKAGSKTTVARLMLQIIAERLAEASAMTSNADR